MADDRGESSGDDERQAFLRRRRARNWALFAVLAVLVVVFYAVTIVRMGGS